MTIIIALTELGLVAWQRVLHPVLIYYTTGELRRAKHHLISAAGSQLLLSAAVILSYTNMILNKPPTESNLQSNIRHAMATLGANPLLSVCGILVLGVAILHSFRPRRMFENTYTRSARHAILLLSLLPYLQQVLLVAELCSFSSPLVHLMISVMIMGKSAVCKQFLRPHLPKQSLLMLQILLRIAIFVIECRNEAHDTSRIVFLTFLLVWHLHLSYQLSGLRNSAVTWSLYLCTTGSVKDWNFGEFLQHIVSFFASAPNAVPDESTTTTLMIFRACVPLVACCWVYSQEAIGMIPVAILLGLALWEMQQALDPPLEPGARLELLLGVHLNFAREVVNVPHRAKKLLKSGTCWVLNIPENQYVPTAQDRAKARAVIERNKNFNERKRAENPKIQNPDEEATEPEILYQGTVNGKTRIIMY